MSHHISSFPFGLGYTHFYRLYTSTCNKKNTIARKKGLTSPYRYYRLKKIHVDQSWKSKNNSNLLKTYLKNLEILLREITRSPFSFSFEEKKNPNTQWLIIMQDYKQYYHIATLKQHSVTLFQLCNLKKKPPLYFRKYFATVLKTDTKRTWLD